METAWFFRLFFVNIGWFIASWILFFIIKAKRMSGPGPSTWWSIAFLALLLIGWILTWFITYSINLAFWIGLSVIIFGEVVFALGFMAMRENPEKKQAVVDWGIYRFSRHSHVIAGMICLLGIVIMGWNPDSIVYIGLWIYFALYVVYGHLGVLNEEKLNVVRFGQEYVEYMNRTPRWIGIPKS